jgi:hypothetical protein
VAQLQVRAGGGQAAGAEGARTRASEEWVWLVVRIMGIERSYDMLLCFDDGEGSGKTAR